VFSIYNQPFLGKYKFKNVDKNRLKELLAQYFNHTINPTDCEELLAYLSSNKDIESSEILDELLMNRNDGPSFNAVNADKVFDRIKTSPDFNQKSDAQGKSSHRLYQNTWFRVAAILLVVFSVGMLFYLNSWSLRQNNSTSLAESNANKSLSPVSMLKLSDGKVIELDHVKNGLIMIANGAKISKSKDGQLIYDISSGSDNNQPEFHTLSTAKGKEYQVNLPDGTRVWLNSSSVLVFPTSFSGSDRTVQLKGEAYFEVAKNKNKPFKVSAQGTTVKVLGTHFNVMAYDDEAAVTTTLLEGAVKVGVADSELAIRPGQQAIVKRVGNSIVVSEVNTADAMAWKNGYFKFQDEDIKSIMKKVCRWYDVEVEYQGVVDDQKFGGTFYRAKSLVELLNYLEKLGTVKFKIAGRRIIVMA
jgi:transmembrane sensor